MNLPDSRQKGGVESELVVRSPHSGMQAAPETIEEVRRILLEHSESSHCPIPDTGDRFARPWPGASAGGSVAIGRSD